MNSSSFHFKVGKFKCMAISDGSIPITNPAQVLFMNAPEKQLSQALRSSNFQGEGFLEVFTCLLIQTGEHSVLVDTGLGLIDSVPTSGKLLQNLHAEGIEPDEIDTVIISHAHGDHIGGNTDSNGQATFPQAEYYMRKEEWDFWTSEATLTNPKFKWMTDFADKNLLQIRDRFHLLSHDIEIVPGVNTLFAPGHTPGNMALVIKSGVEQLLYLGDIVLHPIHLEHPDWYSEPDCLPKKVVLTRRLLLEHAAIDHSLIFAYHLNFPGLGYAIAQEENWKWQAVEIPE